MGTLLNFYGNLPAEMSNASPFRTSIEKLYDRIQISFAYYNAGMHRHFRSFPSFPVQSCCIMIRRKADELVVCLFTYSTQGTSPVLGNYCLCWYRVQCVVSFSVLWFRKSIIKWANETQDLRSTLANEERETVIVQVKMKRS